MNEDINSYLEALLEHKGMVDLPKSILSKAKEDLLTRLEQWMLISFIRALPDSEAVNIEKFAETSPNVDQIMEYFKSKIPNWQDVYQESLASFEEAYLG